jgi:hypothetical protein
MLTSPAENDTVFFQMARCGFLGMRGATRRCSTGSGAEARYIFSPFGRTSVRLEEVYGGENEDDALRRDPHSFAPCPVRAFMVRWGLRLGRRRTRLREGESSSHPRGRVEGDSEQRGASCCSYSLPLRASAPASLVNQALTCISSQLRAPLHLFSTHALSACSITPSLLLPVASVESRCKWLGAH